MENKEILLIKEHCKKIIDVNNIPNIIINDSLRTLENNPHIMKIQFKEYDEDKPDLLDYNKEAKKIVEWLRYNTSAALMGELRKEIKEIRDDLWKIKTI